MRLLDLRVPVPAIDEQQQIVAAYSSSLARIAELEGKATDIEAEAAGEFEKELGVASPPPLPERPMFVAHFKDIERWSHESILRSILHVQDQTPKHEIVRLGTIGKVAYGLQKSPANRPTSHARPYLRVANVQRWRLDLSEIKTINVPDEEMPKYRLEQGDVLLCEGNSPDLVGRGAIWRDEIPDCVHQNHVLRVRLDQGKVLPEFVLAVINSGYGQAYFRSKAKRTTNLASINSKEVAGFDLPLPPLFEQRLLIERLFGRQDEAQRTREEAKQLRAQAWVRFEEAIYAAADGG